LAKQLSLLAPRPLEPEGLHYQPDFISEDEERALLANIAALPFENFQFGIYEGKRRVVYFGARYDFTHHRLEPAANLPGWITPLVERTEVFAELPPGSIRHALFTEYDVGAGIGWHRDKKEFGAVFGISLASPCKFRFRRRSGNKWERFTLDCAQRSLYVMRGEARSAWEHSIPEVSEKRYSITFRTMA
jgi:alkylated DNA repair dioxygenase AlkB